MVEAGTVTPDSNNNLYVTLGGPMYDVNCGDGRTPVDTTLEQYAKLLGGTPALAWDAMTIQEYLQPGSVQISLVDKDKEFAESGLYKKAHINQGVHSDEHNEGVGATEINVKKIDGGVGCGRWQKGAEIAKAALEHIDVIIEEIKDEANGVIAGLEDEARGLAKAGAELADRTLDDGRPVLPSGREVVLGAISNGAKGIVLAGEHAEEDAGYNTKPGETNDNFSTDKHFGVDGWIESKFFADNKDVLPFDERLVVLQSVIISKATKLVLAGSSKVERVR